MNNNKIISGFKLVFIDILFPIFIYLFITIFMKASVDTMQLFFGFESNIMLTTGVSALVTSIALLPLYFKNVKNRYYNIKHFDIKNIKYILGIGVSLCLFFNILLILLNIVQNDMAAKEVSDAILNLNPIMALVIAIIITPICEEIIFRGLIYKSVEYKTNFYIAATISSLLFALLHGNISQGLYAFFVGFMLCYVYERFGGLKYSFFLHSVMNFSSLFLNGIFSYEESKRKDQILILILSLVLFIITMIRVKQNETLDNIEKEVR